MLRNDSARPLTAIVAERRWVRDALTADRVTALQAFRDLFSEQVLRPGDEVAVARITLLFTDLKRVNDPSARIGAASASPLVPDHSASPRATERRHDAALAKRPGHPTIA